MRSNDLLQIRPVLELSTSKDQSPIEIFQNSTLRPILKLQHSITLRLLMDDKNFSKQLRQFQTKEQLHAGINVFMKSNKAFRSQVIGCVIGMITMEEYELYYRNASEFNKRIMNMQVQRYVDSIKI